jgi:hypothetical protein
MVTWTNIFDYPFAPPGACCPCCCWDEMVVSTNNRGRAVLTCVQGNVLIRLVRRLGDPAPALVLGDDIENIPSAGGWWLNYTLDSTGICRPVALGCLRVARRELPGAIVIICATDAPLPVVRAQSPPLGVG